MATSSGTRRPQVRGPAFLIFWGTSGEPRPLTPRPQGRWDRDAVNSTLATKQRSAVGLPLFWAALDVFHTQHHSQGNGHARRVGAGGRPGELVPSYLWHMSSDLLTGGHQKRSWVEAGTAAAKKVTVMKYAYNIEEERLIAERAELVVRGLTLGTVKDGEAIKTLRAARLYSTRAISTLSAVAVNSARRDIALASLGLIQALKMNGPRDQKIETALKAVEDWKRELATQN
jgi:hypothetical protein